ncbi:spermatogenesis-associated protein 24-like [Haliotis cracherodii]|uniref:spermatogenesis-associated protein 24-like n=1 Tax=Haliotis cracherodii TaxID=6455 RepID=UPI0039E946CC
MAADVREANCVVTGETTRGSDPYPSSLPSHIIVQNQLRDIILAQNEVVTRLGQNVSQQESFIRENLMSREDHQSKMQELQVSMLEDYVPRDDYEKVLNDYETEKLEHAQTKGKLMEVTDKLEFALGQIEVLTKQLEREKTAFENAFGSLKTKAIKETSKNQQLENRCQDIARRCSEKEGVLHQKQEEIRVLERKLREQARVSKYRVSELEVQRQQDRYIASIMGGDNKKTKIGTSKHKF